MSKFEIPYLIDVFSTLGQQLCSPDGELSHIIQNECHYNAWFTPDNVEHAVQSIGRMLNRNDLQTWLSKYPIEPHEAKNIGLVLAGNIPLVGFHDVLSVLVSGNIALIKASSQDSRLVMQVLKRLVAIEPAFAERFKFTGRLENFDAVIATGSNNTSRYFEYYFGKVPHIIRKNRNSIAVLTGKETDEQLKALGHDIFDYFGLGCRNVSKLFVPKGYNFEPFFEAIESYKNVIHHHKYNNNYDYNKSLYLVNRDKHLDNGFLLLKEDKGMTSPLAVLFYEYYESIDSLSDLLENEKGNIQCVVTAAAATATTASAIVGFGQSQQPALWDYADGVDTMDFLTKL
ncbi:MAG: acyl-CoA reductase [Bacteroidetes bacterium]|nr:acyl-CoA reductase [Bacteroidota bacterium]